MNDTGRHKIERGYCISVNAWFSQLNSLPAFRVGYRNLRMIGLLFLLIALPSSSFSTPLAAEYDLKAAYLYKMIKFIDWPTEAFDREDSPLRICIVGPDPFSASFYELHGKIVKGRPLTILRFNHGDHVAHCHILYISIRDKRRVSQLIKKISGLPIVTVSDNSKFVKQQGMIGFINKSQHMLIEINLEVAQAAQIVFRAQLLEVAHRVIRSREER